MKKKESMRPGTGRPENEKERNETMGLFGRKHSKKTEDEIEEFWNEEYAEEYDNPYDDSTPSVDESESLWLAHDSLDTDDTFDMEWYELSHDRDNRFLSIRHMARGIIVVFVIAAVIIAWIFGIFYYSAHFFNKSYINGLDVSGMTAEEAQETVLLQEPVYVFTVVFPDSEFIISDTDVTLELKPSPTMREVMGKQSLFLWPFEELVENRYSVDLVPSYNEETMRAWLTSELHRMNEKLTANGFERVDVTEAREQILEAMPSGSRLLDLSGRDEDEEEKSEEEDSE